MTDDELRELAERFTKTHAGSLTHYDYLVQFAKQVLEPIQNLVNQQAEDEGLWFSAATAPEAYLQQELRKLHAVIEGE